jgi:hypothetical protein
MVRAARMSYIMTAMLSFEVCSCAVVQQRFALALRARSIVSPSLPEAW